MDEREPQRHREMRDQGEQHLAWRVLHRFHRTMHAHRQLMTKMLAERDIHPGQAICLRELAHNDGVAQRDLAALMCVSRPTVTVMLQKMERAGLVERTADAADQRYTRIHLTEAGWRVHEEMHHVLSQFAAETIGQLKEAEQREFERLLGLFGDQLTAALGDAG